MSEDFNPWEKIDNGQWEMFDGTSSESGDPWLLGQIGPKKSGGEAIYGLGYLMYDLPIDPLSDMVRKGEVTIGTLLDKGGKSVGEFANALRSAGLIKKGEQVSDSMLQNLALYHRKGHLEGLRKVMEETGTQFLTTLLENSSLKADKLNPSHLVYQVAAILEASGNNAQLRGGLHSVLEQSEFWKTNKGDLNNFKIPGLNEEELNGDSFFKGATLAPLPLPTPSKLDKMYQVWQANRAASTYKRAMKFISPRQK